MADYEHSMTITAPADAIFDFVADVSNLPKYLPTTKHAQSQGQDRVRVAGEAQGNHYEADGYLRPDRARHRLEWGADEQYYSGHLEIHPHGDTSEVTVHISLRGKTPESSASNQPSDAQIQEALRTALESIQNQVTGQGGKKEPSAAT